MGFTAHNLKLYQAVIKLMGIYYWGSKMIKKGT